MGGDAVEMEELEGSHAEGGGDGGGEGVGALEEGGDAGVEGDLPAEDAKDEGVGEVAVGLREGGHGGAVEEVVGVGVGVGYADEDGEGGGTGGGDGGVRWAVGAVEKFAGREIWAREFACGGCCWASCWWGAWACGNRVGLWKT